MADNLSEKEQELLQTARTLGGSNIQFKDGVITYSDRHGQIIKEFSGIFKLDCLKQMVRYLGGNA
jgi:hypothetical protein